MASCGGRGEGALWRGAEPNRARGGVLVPPSGNARRATRWGALQAAGGAGSSAAHGRLPAPARYGPDTGQMRAGGQHSGARRGALDGPSGARALALRAYRPSVAAHTRAPDRTARRASAGQAGRAGRQAGGGAAGRGGAAPRAALAKALAACAKVA